MYKTLSNNNPYTIPKSHHTASKIAQSAYERREKGIALREQCTKFKNNLQPALLTEALNFVLQKSLPESTTEEDRAYGKKLCENFVAENNSTMLLKKFKCKTVFLAEMALAVECTCKKVENSINPADQLSFTVKTKDKKDFFDSLANLSDDEITDKIQERVAKSTEEFVKNNIKDKAKMEDAANKTKERIDDIKVDDEETAEAIKKEHVSMYKSKVEQITSNRKRNVYEQIVNQMTSSIMKTDSIRESFINEGRLDMPKIISKVNVMYTFLEMVNTTKMHKVDERYISEVLKSIK